MTHGAPAPYSKTEYLSYEKEKEFQFGTTKLTLPALKVNDNIIIYVLNIMGGRPEHITIFATDLLYGLDFDTKMKGVMPIDGFITVEGKAIHLAYEIAAQTEMPYVVLRKSCKPYMGEKVLSAKVKTITTGDEEDLYLDNRDMKWLQNSRLVFIDDVISSGATLKATEEIVNMVNGKIVGCLAMAIEGGYKPNIPTFYLAELPIIKLK